MNVTITPGKAHGVITAPPSKSMAHRLLIAGALSEGKSTICGISLSKDIEATLRCLHALGAEYTLEGDKVTIGSLRPACAAKKAVLDCGESGSTLRFLLPLCLLSGKEIILTGSDYLLERPMEIYEKLCRQNGFDYQKKSDGIHVKGVLKPGEYRVPGNVSSQFISGLLFALPLLSGDSKISITPPVESVPYIELTLDALHTFGVDAVFENERTIRVPSAHFSPRGVTVEGDYSNAAFFEALNVLGGDVTIEGLLPDSRQGDRAYRKMFPLLRAGTASLHLGDCIDLAPICFALAAVLHGGIFGGTRRLAMKESDRASAMAEELRKFGTRVTVGENHVVIVPTDFHAPNGILCGHNDHRVVMSLAVLLTRTGGTISGAEAVNKSFPGFFEALSSLGIGVKYENNQ